MLLGRSLMFRSGGTVIGHGLKIVGNVSAEGLVEVNGQIEGEVSCTSLVVSPNAKIVGSVTAEHVVVNGSVEGPNLSVLKRGPSSRDAHHKRREATDANPPQLTQKCV
jgi:cytoskeletal protein CcmA (bactofilin family)